MSKDVDYFSATVSPIDHKKLKKLYAITNYSADCLQIHIQKSVSQDFYKICCKFAILVIS